MMSTTDGFSAFMLALAKDRLVDSKKAISKTANAVQEIE